MTFQLRDYQDTGVGDIRKFFATYRSLLYVLPTGGGKTRVFSYITEAASAKGNSVCIVVHRQELVTQASMSLADLGIRHRVIAPPAVVRQCMELHMESYGRSFIHQASHVMVASVQTLVKRIDILSLIRLLIIDEAHHSTAGSWAKCIAAMQPNAKILGVTATPVRRDGAGLRTHFEHMIVGVSMQELIDRGYLCIPKIYAPVSPPDFSSLNDKVGLEWEHEAEKIVDNRHIIGDAVQHYKQLCDGVPAIAYCHSVKHAEHVAAQFREAGYKFVAIDGTTDRYIRQNALRDLGRGDIHGVASCDIISEGTDVPLVGCGIMLRKTDSTGLYMQQAGRVLRPYPNNEVMKRANMQCLYDAQGRHQAFILDHVGNTMVHGMPQMDREWSLDAPKKKQKRKTMVPIKQCPKCYRIHEPAPECPQCGFQYEVLTAAAPLPKVKEGQLNEITAAWFEGRDIVGAPLKEVLKKAKTEQEVREIAKARGYKEGWVKNVMKFRSGRTYGSRVV